MPSASDLKNGEAGSRQPERQRSRGRRSRSRSESPPGVVFLAEGVTDGNANALLNGGPVQVKIEKLSEVSA